MSRKTGKIGIKHDITDPGAFVERGDEMIRAANLPEGVEPEQFCSPTDGTTATCISGAESVDQLKDRVDPTLGDANTQEYLAVGEGTAFDLPE